MHNPNRRLCAVVDQRYGEVGNPQPACLRLPAERDDNIMVTGHDNYSQQGYSYPPQVQKDLQVAVVSLIRMPPVDTPDFLESQPEPEALEARPVQWVPGLAEDQIPDSSPAGKGRVSSDSLHKSRADIGSRGEGDDQDRHYGKR